MSRASIRILAARDSLPKSDKLGLNTRRQKRHECRDVQSPKPSLFSNQDFNTEENFFGVAKERKVLQIEDFDGLIGDRMRFPGL